MAKKKVNEEEVEKVVVKEYKLSYPKVIKKIKFKTYNQKRFYLTLASHAESNDEIYKRISLSCKTERYPFSL